MKQIRTFGGTIVHVDEVVNQFLRTLSDAAKPKVLQSAVGEVGITVTVVYDVIPK